MAELTYNYSSGGVSHFALKRVDGICRERDKGRATLIGVFCKTCEHYIGVRSGYVVCGNKSYMQDDAGPNVGDVRTGIVRGIKHNALCALDG